MKKLKIVICFIMFMLLVFIINRNYCNAIEIKKVGVGGRIHIKTYTNDKVTWIIQDNSIIKQIGQGGSNGSNPNDNYKYVTIEGIREGTTNVFGYSNGDLICAQTVEVKKDFL